jgi:hypothetical protein
MFIKIVISFSKSQLEITSVDEINKEKKVRTRSVCSPTLVHRLSPECSERVRIVLTACMKIEFFEQVG